MHLDKNVMTFCENYNCKYHANLYKSSVLGSPEERSPSHPSFCVRGQNNRNVCRKHWREPLLHTLSICNKVLTEFVYGDNNTYQSVLYTDAQRSCTIS